MVSATASGPLGVKLVKSSAIDAECMKTNR